MKTLLALSLAVIMASGGCGDGGDKPSGTRDDPIGEREAGRRCVTVGQWAYDEKGRELVCRRRSDDASTRWLTPRD